LHTSPSPSSLSISSFRDALKGRVIAPEDAGYDEARAVFSGGINGHPAVILRPVDAADVARAVTLARDTGLPFAIRNGGHSGAGHCTTDGGIVLDTRDMHAIDINVEQRTARADAGLTAAEYTKAAGAHGLATGFGDTGSVGITGITLGGGIGYLTRKYGLTIDSVRAVELVTADGQQLQVSAESHPDLFWAIRGGGGNFGVVTKIHYELHPVNRVIGGMLMLPATPEVVLGAIDAAAAAPEELSAIINVMPAPPMPFVPAEHHGKMVVMALICSIGDDEASARAVAPFKALGKPIVDMVRPITYPEMFPPDDPNYHPAAVARSFFLDRFDRGVADTILEWLKGSDAMMKVTQLRVLGGAMARVPADATAFAHRHASIMGVCAAFYTSPEDKKVREDWTIRFAAALQQGNNGVYVNFLADEGEARIHAAYPGKTWDRLAAVKAKYDPTNFFKLNQNIPPRA
jgi:FAD/FMN-containing dehydrogenase